MTGKPMEINSERFSKKGNRYEMFGGMEEDETKGGRERRSDSRRWT